MTSFDPSEFIQLIMGLFLGVIGYMVRQVLERLKHLEASQSRNTGRLIRIETKLGIANGWDNEPN